MGSSPWISDVEFVSARPADVRRGLLGFVSATVDGALRLEGIALRRTSRGELALSFPTRVDGSGITRHYVRPTSDEARRAIERAVLSELELHGAGGGGPR